MRLYRADRHLADADTLIDEWASDCNNHIVSDNNGKAWFPNGFPPIDQALPLIVSDAIHNLRSALDYVVYELALHDSGNVQHGTQFIIEDVKDDPLDASRGFDVRAKRYLKGLSLDHVRAMEWFQPYMGAKWTETLREISNPDKHRKLIVLTAKGRQIQVTLKHGPSGRFLTGDFHMTAEGPVLEYVDFEFDGRETIAVAITEIRTIAVMPTLRIIETGVNEVIEAFKPAF